MYITKPLQVFLCTFNPVNVKEYLLTTKALNLSQIAHLMWPKNQTAEAYLYRKLHGTRPFTDKDAASAIKVLHELGHVLINLTT